MELTNAYLQNLAKYVQSYIINNSNRFSYEEYFEVLCNLCIVENLKIRENYEENDMAKRVALIMSSTDEMIMYYMIAAEKLLPSLYSSDFDDEVHQKVYNWTFEADAKTKYYNLDYSKIIEAYF